MSLFLVFAAALVLFTLAVFGLTLWRAGNADTANTDLVATNIAIARERLAALDAAHADTDPNNPDYVDERKRIEAQLARELAPSTRTRRSRLADLGLMGILAIGLPATTAWLYLQIGTPAAIDPPPAQQNAAQGPSLLELVDGLEKRLAESPSDVTGWRMLGRTRFAMTDFELAANAFSIALELQPDDVDTLANLAEARAMMDEGNLTGAALPLLERAHQIAPEHEQSMWLLGVARQQNNQHREALVLFTRLRSLLEARNDFAAISTVDEFLARSQELLGAVTPNASSTPAPTTENDTDTPSTTSLTVSVRLGEAATNALAPETPVFVFARAASGPPMPLAVQRLVVSDLPTMVVLDETMAMIPNMTLANFSDLVVGARAAVSGQAIAASGDWTVETEATLGVDGTAEAPVTLSIEEQLP